MCGIMNSDAVFLVPDVLIVGPQFRASLVIELFSIPVQLKLKRLCECFRA